MAESLAIIAVLLAILGLLDWILTESQKAAFSVWTLWLWDKLDDLRKRFFKEWGVGRQFRKIYWSVLIPLFLFDFAEWIYHILIGHRDFWLATHGFAPEIVGFYAPVLVGYVFVRTISKLGSFLGKISWMALGLCCMGLLVVSAHALQAYLLVIGVRENDPHFSEDWISVFISEKYTYNHILRTWRSAVQFIATLIIFITAPLALLFSIEVIMRRIAENSKGSIIALVGLLTAIAALLKAFS